eukprot:1192531-Prorocentrum_minimum.AAC.2
MRTTKRTTRARLRHHTPDKGRSDTLVSRIDGHAALSPSCGQRAFGTIRIASCPWPASKSSANGIGGRTEFSGGSREWLNKGLMLMPVLLPVPAAAAAAPGAARSSPAAPGAARSGCSFWRRRPLGPPRPPPADPPVLERSGPACTPPLPAAPAPAAPAPPAESTRLPPLSEPTERGTQSQCSNGYIPAPQAHRASPLLPSVLAHPFQPSAGHRATVLPFRRAATSGFSPENLSRISVLNFP